MSSYIIKQFLKLGNTLLIAIDLLIYSIRFYNL
jgi:hypothetical protein